MSRPNASEPANPEPDKSEARGSDPVQYLTRPQMAQRWGLQPDTLNRYKLPHHDAEIGRIRGWLPETADRWRDPLTRADLEATDRDIRIYLTRNQVATRLGLRPDSLSSAHAKLPDHDAEIGTYRGWLPETIDTWAPNRPRRRSTT